jgi:hypothetical protein
MNESDLAIKTQANAVKPTTSTAKPVPMQAVAKIAMRRRSLLETGRAAINGA